jgi:UrcA family protein
MSAIKLNSESMRRARVRALVLVGSALAIGSSLAQAGPAIDTPAVTVKYSELDLATDEGASKLYNRIATAARVACPDSNSRDLRASASGKACQSEAIARAVRDVHSPRLAEAYNAHTSHG